MFFKKFIDNEQNVFEQYYFKFGESNSRLHARLSWDVRLKSSSSE